MSPRYKNEEWSDESYDAIDWMIDNDPMELAKHFRNCIRALTALRSWDMLSLDVEGHGVATADAPWARGLIADALDPFERNQ